MKRQHIFKICLSNLESDVEQAEQIIAVGGKPNGDLLGTLRINLEVVTKYITASVGDPDVLALRTRAQAILDG